MNEQEELLRHFIRESHDDEVGLWYIVKNVRRQLRLSDATQVREVTMDFVRRILESGRVLAGYYDASSSFETWCLTSDDVIARINDEWDRLGRDPNIGEIVVFVGKRED